MADHALPMRLVGHWWIIRGRHGEGFHIFDALNMSGNEAQSRAQMLLPTIRDEQVREMAAMMEASDD